MSVCACVCVLVCTHLCAVAVVNSFDCNISNNAWCCTYLSDHLLLSSSLTFFSLWCIPSSFLPMLVRLVCGSGVCSKNGKQPVMCNKNVGTLWVSLFNLFTASILIWIYCVLTADGVSSSSFGKKDYFYIYIVINCLIFNAQSSSFGTVGVDLPNERKCWIYKM